MISLLLAAGLLARGQPALDAVRPQAISAHVRFLSDDLLEGRYSGARGHAIAERYVIAQLAALGVLPAGEGGGWLQQVPLRQARTDGSTLDADGAALDDVVIAGDGGASREIEGALQFAGYALESDPLPDLRGKIALVLTGAPASLPSSERAIAGSNDAKLRRLGKAGAVAEIILDTQEVEARRPWKSLQRNFRNGETFAADALPPLPVAYVNLADSERIRKAARARLHLVQAVRAYVSANVAGILPGAHQRPSSSRRTSTTTASASRRRRTPSATAPSTTPPASARCWRSRAASPPCRTASGRWPSSPSPPRSWACSARPSSRGTPHSLARR